MIKMLSMKEATSSMSIFTPQIMSGTGGRLAAASLLLLALLATGCSEPQARASEAAAPPQVGVITVKPQETLRITELPGRTTSALTSEVRPQVNGVIQKRLFTEGSEVKEGQQLYQIDPATYKATYESALATLARGQAALATANAKAVRYKTLIAAQVVSHQDYDDIVAIAKQAQADIVSAQASVEQARINLEYTKVRSPISGRISHSAVTPGALVTANQTTALATVTQLDPVYVDVNQSVATLLRLKREMAAGEIERVDDGSAKVTLRLDDGSTYPFAGKLEFSEVTVDQGTGTVLLRAVFPNPQHLLLPGMYVHALMQEGINRNGIAVPQKAVTRNTHGEPTVLVVEPDNTVTLRSIQTGQALGDQWIVNEGLRAGDRVVVDGLQSVRPGAVVVPVEAGAERAVGAVSSAENKHS